MKPKKLIEVALPIKEISAESVRDKSIRHGHISTLHLWWARRPLPTCRAIVFASLVPDPMDPNTPQAFRDAVEYLLKNQDPYVNLMYKPYKDIPYTVIIDPMEDNPTNRLMMFIGKFSDKCQENMIAGKSTPPKEQLAEGSLIKWENKNNPKVINIARELIWVAYNSDKDPNASFEGLHREFEEAHGAISVAENNLYSIPNRHLGGKEVEEAEAKLKNAIEAFQSRMPSVFDPFAGGGAIPLEAARLGCRSFGNDINPVAHIIEKGSAEFPQKFGKQLVISRLNFDAKYGKVGYALLQNKGLLVEENITIPNILSFDVEFYAIQLLKEMENSLGKYYPSDEFGNKAVAYYWVRTAQCSNPSCKADVPLLKQFYLANTPNKKIYLSPCVDGNNISFEIKSGKCPDSLKGWIKRGNMTCPCCGSVTNVDDVKSQSVAHFLNEKLVAVIGDGTKGKTYSLPTSDMIKLLSTKEEDYDSFPEQMPIGYNQAFPSCLWGYTRWSDIFSYRQFRFLNVLLNKFNELKSRIELNSYNKSVLLYLAIWIDRIAIANTSFSIWHNKGEKLERILGRQSLSMTFDYPESNPLCGSSGSALNQLDWIIRFLETESSSEFPAKFANSSSGDKSQFETRSLTATVTDPPYYDAIGYADCSDFFYVWLKRTMGDLFPNNFNTPQTPKTEECTAIKHHHENEAKAREHFEKKLTQIFDAIEMQTKDIVSIMFAHQSTEAWTTLCNSILDAKMNITGSWPMDTEMQGALKTNMGFLESSVTVACRPAQRKGYGEFKEVKKDIEKTVKEEVDKLYELGFRGADLLTACFGQAVSEFGKYKAVEKADGTTVSVAELLEMVRQSAFNALLEGINADDETRFYIGWLQLNGAVDCDFDDATKFTRVGVNIEISNIISRKILLRDGNKVRIAMAADRIIGNHIGFNADDAVIDQVQRAIYAYNEEDKVMLLRVIRVCAQESSAPFWRVLASLKELLPANADSKAVQGILLMQESLRADCNKDLGPTQASFDFDYQD